MNDLDCFDKLFVYTACALQLILLAYFALRKWEFPVAMKIGWAVYALGIPALGIAFALMRAGKPWPLWLGGLLFAAWAAFGYLVDIARPVAWRSPAYLPVLIPYVVLYLSAQMFYWWPLGMLQRPLWYAYAPLFLASSLLNLSSHAR